MWKAIALGVITVYMGTAFVYSVFLDSNVLLSATELPVEHWKLIWGAFFRVTLYNLTLTGSVGFTTYHVTRKFWQTIKGD